MTGASVLNGFSLFGSKSVQKDNDQTTFKESPNSSSNNLHIVITGSVVGIILLIVAMIAIHILRDKRQEELTNRARIEPNIQPQPQVLPQVQSQHWFPSAPIPPQIPQINNDFMYNQYRQPAENPP